MKRINLVKYGFVRWPEKDFHDDGSNFTCYRAGKNVRVSKLVSNGQVYLSADSTVGNGSLPYSIYSKLPHYNAAEWKYNGVSLDSLTDQDLEDFMAACVAYEKEYEETEATIKYPTIEELTDKAHQIVSKRLFELSKAENLLKRNVRDATLNFSTHEWQRVQECIKHLKSDVETYSPETYPQKILGKEQSFRFAEPNTYMDENYWFKCFKELFDKYNMK